MELQPHKGAIANQRTILRGLVGSRVHGLNLDEQDDRDEMGVFIEPALYAIGVRKPLDHWIERTQPEGVRSGPGDLDLSLYSLRKFVRLALGGNPSIVTLLYTPERHLLVNTSTGQWLIDHARWFHGPRLKDAYRGYMHQQKQRLLGERGQMRVHRPELIEAHGYDTKYAMHVARLGVQGIELLTTGHLTLPMVEPHRSKILAVRRGEMDYYDTLNYINEIEEELREAPAPTGPHTDEIEAWMVDTYLRMWDVER